MINRVSEMGNNRFCTQWGHIYWEKHIPYFCMSIIIDIFIIADEPVIIDGSDELIEGQWRYSNNETITYFQMGKDGTYGNRY